MLAYFHKGEFFGMWQDQSSMGVAWVEQTTQALGHRKEDVEVYHCPALANSQSFFFDENKHLVMGEKVTQTVEGEDHFVMHWKDPLPLERFYPAP